MFIKFLYKNSINNRIKMSTAGKLRDTTNIQIQLRQQQKLQGRYYTLDQKEDRLECLLCCFCEGANEYAVGESDPNFNVNNKKGYIREESDCLGRVFCVCNRPFTAELKLFNEEVAVAERPCNSCIEWMPCLENELVVTTKSGRQLGVLKVGCMCCTGSVFAIADASIQIYSPETQELMYTVEGSYCQKSILCPCFRCCYCPNVEYGIYDQMNLKVGKIFNIYNGCCAEVFTRIDKFGIEMPSKAEEEQKILLLFAAMYMDYLRYQTPYFCLGVR